MATNRLTFSLRTFSRVAKKRTLFEGRALCHMFPSNVYFLLHSCYVRFTRAVSQRSNVNSHLCLSFTFFCPAQTNVRGSPMKKIAKFKGRITLQTIANGISVNHFHYLQMILLLQHLSTLKQSFTICESDLGNL